MATRLLLGAIAGATALLSLSAPAPAHADPINCPPGQAGMLCDPNNPYSPGPSYHAHCPPGSVPDPHNQFVCDVTTGPPLGPPPGCTMPTPWGMVPCRQ